MPRDRENYRRWKKENYVIAHKREKRMEQYAERKAAGLCTNCGKRPRNETSLVCDQCRTPARKRAIKWVDHRRQQVLEAYGGAKCACCGETEILFLTIDHINNDGAQHRREINAGGYKAGNLYNWLIENKFPPGYQVLCQNCNSGKWRNGGICPHQGKRVEDGNSVYNKKNSQGNRHP